MLGRDSFVLGLHNVGARDRLVLDEHLATVCTLRDDLIVDADIHLSDIDGMNAFFVPLPLSEFVAEHHAPRVPPHAQLVTEVRQNG